MALAFAYVAGLLTTPVASALALVYWATRPSPRRKWPKGSRL